MRVMPSGILRSLCNFPFDVHSHFNIAPKMNGCLCSVFSAGNCHVHRDLLALRDGFLFGTSSHRLEWLSPPGISTYFSWVVDSATAITEDLGLSALSMDRSEFHTVVTLLMIVLTNRRCSVPRRADRSS